MKFNILKMVISEKPNINRPPCSGPLNECHSRMDMNYYSDNEEGSHVNGNDLSPRVDENGGNLLRMETFIGAERPCNIIDYMHEKSNIGNVNWPESRIGHRAAFQERPNLYEFDLPTPILGHKKFQFEITPCHGDGKDAGNFN
ncbi:uncharacterized protein LOC109600350 [Aethina tumida]|uniref:uncharacterized protein LOC109600350 n=1 Tax=Aethina tumida TaxID=116153 RepID=UPI00096B0E6D|nr:uncharacterized protein LOC109600350 [Aethina tumida]